MKTLTQADIEWLTKLLVIIDYIHEEYPELFDHIDEETYWIAKELIRSLK